MVTLADLQEFLRRSGLNDREAACAASAAQVALQQKREAQKTPLMEISQPFKMI